MYGKYKNNSFDEIIKELKSEINDDNLSGLDEILRYYSFHNNYDNIRLKYDSNNVPYQIKNISDLNKVFGYDINEVKGYKNLDEEKKELFETLALRLINGSGLQNRNSMLIGEIELDLKNSRFIGYSILKNTYFYLNFNGNID